MMLTHVQDVLVLVWIRNEAVSAVGQQQKTKRCPYCLYSLYCHVSPSISRERTSVKAYNEKTASLSVTLPSSSVAPPLMGPMASVHN